MGKDYIALATPVFFALIGLEIWAARRRGRRLYRWNDSINDVSTGILQQLATLLLTAGVIGGYLGLYEHARIFDLASSNPWLWVGCFLGVDFFYYWFHRLSHEINFLWAAHVVHHQSEEYNLTVALRQSTLQPFFSAAFYWPLAIVGVPPSVFLTCAAFNTLYQFWIHTRMIDRLGVLEKVLMTPSHHRVHHGRNPIYIDRNHGGTFIVWDKLFGTFEPESEEVTYGITKPLASWNPVWANLHYWVELWESARRTRRWKDKLLVFLEPPGWFPDDLGGFQPPPEVGPHPEKFDTPFPAGLSAYAAVALGQVVVLLSAMQIGHASIPLAVDLGFGAAIVWGLVDLGGLFESRSWAIRCERVRIMAMPIIALPLVALPLGWLVPALFALCLPALGSGALRRAQ